VDADVARALALDRTEGVLIRGLQRGGPADRAGLRVRDVVVDVEGRPTLNTTALLSRIAQLPPGTVAKVSIVRDGRPMTVDVTVGRRPRAE
jgi:serine protease DegQ